MNMITECSDCAEPLTDEERDYPNVTPEGDTVCDRCQSNYEFECCICSEMDSIEFQHKILAVFEPDTAFHTEGKQRGLYKIIELPYWTDGMITAWVHEWAVERIAPLPDGAESDGYACGHLCRDCVAKIPSNPSPQPAPPTS